MPDKSKLMAELARMEDGFSAMAQENDIIPAAEHFAAPDVAFIDTDPRKFRGPSAVRERMAGTPTDMTLTWSALFTDVSDDGTLGYNYGRYEARGRGPDGKEFIRGGFFLSIWKRQPDGSWKYVMDTGAPDKKGRGGCEGKGVSGRGDWISTAPLKLPRPLRFTAPAAWLPRPSWSARRGNRRAPAWSWDR